MVWHPHSNYDRKNFESSFVNTNPNFVLKFELTGINMFEKCVFNLLMIINFMFFEFLITVINRLLIQMRHMKHWKELNIFSLKFNF
jgi:hypothetical protein